jgi:hypothetical protein
MRDVKSLTMRQFPDALTRLGVAADEHLELDAERAVGGEGVVDDGVDDHGLDDDGLAPGDKMPSGDLIVA